MRVLLLSFLSLLAFTPGQAQDCDGTDYTVLTGGFYYIPAALTITAGETIAFVNEGGTHDVNGQYSTLGDNWDNPETFYLSAVEGAVEGVCIGQITLTIPGTYQYDCSIYGHAGQGMVGTITVMAVVVAGCTDMAACNYNAEANEDDASCTYVDGVCDTCVEGMVVDNDSDDDGVCNGDEVLGCTDGLACNFDSTATDAADCIYFDTDLFLLSENDFINTFDTSGWCNGYSTWNSLPVPMGQDSANAPLTLTLFPEVEEYLTANGFVDLVLDLSTVQISVCGTTMNYDSEVIGLVNSEWDGMGFINPLYGAYLVPESSLPIGCPDPDACNFDPCSHPFMDDDCEYIMSSEIMGDTALVAGGTYTFTYSSLSGNAVTWESDCTEMITVSGDSATFMAADQDCSICATETNAAGCENTVCQLLSVTISSVVEHAATWALYPNPAQNFVQIDWTETASTLVIIDGQGRTVQTAQVTPGKNVIPLNDLPSGAYFIGPQGSMKGGSNWTRLQVIR